MAAAQYTCQHCGAKWVGRKKKYCSLKCWKDANVRTDLSAGVRRCATCGKEFEAKPKQKHCSEQCRNGTVGTRDEYIARIRENSKHKTTCGNCGKVFIRKPGGADRENGCVNRYCSMACRKDHASKSREVRKAARIAERIKRSIRKCAQCGNEFVHASAKTCSDECRRAAARVLARRYDKEKNESKKCVRECAECGKTFKPEYGDKRSVFCSKVCAKKSSNRKKESCHRGRAKKYQVAYESVDPIKVFERDGWMCQICGTHTPRKHRGTTRKNAPELDHRIPMSKGGGHLYENTQCACRQCNGSKGNKSSYGQFPLFSIG